MPVSNREYQIILPLHQVASCWPFVPTPRCELSSTALSEGPEGVKWELGLARFSTLGKWDLGHWD